MQNKAHAQDQSAKENFDRYRYGVNRGHREYTEQAALCERMYLGGGRQWSPEDKKILDDQRRPAYEFNEILPSINAAIGHQIQNRMDIAFRPRGGNADQKRADIFGKLVMHISDRQKLHWKETEIFGDGLIQQRGYYDVRVEFDTNMQGNLCIKVLDPMDVIPDPDAKTYDPEGWADVVVTSWLTADEIEQQFGKDKRRLVEARHLDDTDWGEDDDSGEERSKFAKNASGPIYDAVYMDGGIKRYRVIDRQKWVRTMSRCLFYPKSGDIKVIENMTEEVIAKELASGAVPTKAMQKRVRWVVTTCDVELHNDWSPYDSFTIVPYFAYFRRGQTIGMVDNAIGPQQGLNKALSQYVHIVNTAANSGWSVEENSLTNMSADDLEQKGAMTGLVVEYKKGAQKPEKIQPNQVPQGVDRLIDRMSEALKDVTVPEAMRGISGPEKSGVAIQSKQFASQQQLALPIDNLARTRHMLACKLQALIQQFYTDERTFRITEQDPRTGKDVEEVIAINHVDPMTGMVENDLTSGEYDTVVTEQPMQITFENSQFQQALELRKSGVMIPDPIMIQHSTLSRKAEIVEQMENAEQPSDPLAEAKARLVDAQTRKTIIEAVNKAVESMFSATQAANQVAAVPQVAPLADAMLRSAGFEDMDASPIIPEAPQGLPVADLPTNTNPLTPTNPGVGIGEGIETADPAAGVPA
jgi:hypothetical protein